MKLEDAIGLGLDFIAQEHIFTFMLSSSFTTRTIVHEKGQVDEVKKDLAISLILSIMLSVILGWMFKSWIVFIGGFAFGLLLYYVYALRGDLL